MRNRCTRVLPYVRRHSDRRRNSYGCAFLFGILIAVFSTFLDSCLVSAFRIGATCRKRVSVASEIAGERDVARSFAFRCRYVVFQVDEVVSPRSKTCKTDLVFLPRCWWIFRLMDLLRFGLHNISYLPSIFYLQHFLIYQILWNWMIMPFCRYLQTNASPNCKLFFILKCLVL